MRTRLLENSWWKGESKMKEAFNPQLIEFRLGKFLTMNNNNNA